MRKFQFITILIASVAFSNKALPEEDNRIYYGSRAGMHVTILSKRGIDTSDSSIEIKHTLSDAKAFCVDYAQDRSSSCVSRVMADVKISNRVTANCNSRVWVDMYGRKYLWARTFEKNDNTIFIIDLQSRELLDGSSASGHGTQLTIITQLCPKSFKN